MTSKTLSMIVVFISVMAGVFIENSSGSESEMMEARVVHVPIASVKQGDKLVVRARVDGAAGRVAFMRLYYKGVNEESFRFIEMRQGLGEFSAELPVNQFAGSRLNYFILSFLENQDVLTSPEANPYGDPYEVNIVSGPAMAAPTPPLPSVPESGFVGVPGVGSTLSQSAASEETPILFLSPESGEEFSVGEEVLIAASFLPPEGDTLDPGSVNVFVDGANVTRQTELSESILTYSTSQLPPGDHTIVIQASLESGNPLPRASLTFVVKGERKPRNLTAATRPFRGRVFAETRHESISSIGFSDNNVGASLSGESGIAKYNARVYLTSREDGRDQPRNRYTFNLDLPVVGLTVGDTYPRFNDIVLWGKRVRGFHGRLRLGAFNVDVVKGETVRKVGPLREVVIDTLLNPLMGVDRADSTVISLFGTHSQDLFGLRTSFGSGRNFQLGFNYLKVRDDVNNDTSATQFSVLPRDNLVLGADVMFGLNNRKIEFRGEVAISALTLDITNGPLTREQIEDQFDVELPFDPADIDNFIILNASTTPLDPRDLTSLAYDLSMRLNFLNNNLLVGWKSIGSQYVSLGNSFLRNNIRGLYLQDRIRLHQNKLYLNFGLEVYQDNFDSDNGVPSTNLTTLSAGFSIYPGASWPSLTFNLRNHERDNGLDSLFVGPDLLTQGESNSTTNWSVMLNHDTRFMGLAHTISVSYIRSDRNDKFLPATETSSNVQVITVRTLYRIPLTTTINFARNANNFADGLNEFEFNMFGAKAEYALLKRRLNTYLGIAFTSASGVSAIDTATVTSRTDYKRTAFNTGARFEISPGHFIMVDASLIDFSDNGSTFDAVSGILTPNPSFTDRIVRLFYEKRF